MSKAVLDSSALLALLQEEPGGEAVAAVLPGALLSAVNLAEVAGKLAENGMPAHQIDEMVAALGVVVVPFDAAQACLSGALRPRTRSFGLSLGDRACLALTLRQGLPVLTADTVWSTALPEAQIILIRNSH